MLRVVESQAAHGAGVFWSERGEQQPDVGDVVAEMVRAEDVAMDDARLLRLGEVGAAGGEDSVAVVGAAVAGEETDETLQ